MAFTIRVFGRWTARADDGVWSVLEGPPEIATVLNAVADSPPAVVHVDEQRLREARVLHPDLRVIHLRKAHEPTIH